MAAVSDSFHQFILRYQSRSWDRIRSRAARYEMRHKSVTNVVARYGIKNILELASGLSTRGLSMTANDGEMTYVESDIDRSLQLKRRCLNYFRVTNQLSSRLRLMSADASEYTQLASAAEELNSPIVIVVEGLLSCSAPEVQNVVLTNIQRLLST